MNTLAMAPHHCLLAGDEALIGLALQDILEDAGIPVVGPFTTSAEALASSRQRAPSGAVLDFALKDGPCTELAMHLMAQGVPVRLLGLAARQRGTGRVVEGDVAGEALWPC